MMRLTGYESFDEAVDLLVEGHLKAGEVIGVLIENGLEITDFYHIDDMRIYGEKIWIAYKICDYKPLKLLKCIRNRDSKLIENINLRCKDSDKVKTHIGS